MKPTSPHAPLILLLNDQCVVAVAKPAGLAAIPGRGETDSVLQKLSRQLNLPCTGQNDPRLRVVHRLDKDTSGVLLLAKDINTQRHLSHQFQNNLIKKEYLAIVCGRPADAQGTIDAPLSPHPTQRDRMAVNKHGRRAVTEWKLEWSVRDFSLIRCFPQTGKTHQIRVHLTHVGLPLAIDPLYNPPRQALLLSEIKRNYRPGAGVERPLIQRLTLHAEKLTFVHPSGQSVEVVCPLPRDFKAAVNQLAKLR